jgi:hypothetical protein
VACTIQALSRGKGDSAFHNKFFFLYFPVLTSFQTSLPRDAANIFSFEFSYRVPRIVNCDITPACRTISPESPNREGIYKSGLRAHIKRDIPNSKTHSINTSLETFTHSGGDHHSGLVKFECSAVFQTAK